MKKIVLTEEQLQWTIQRLSENELNETQIGRKFRELWPDTFDKNTALKNLTNRLKIRLREMDYVIPSQKKHKVSPAPYRWLKDNPELVVDYEPRIAVISDVHAGGHDADVIEFIAETIEKRGVNVVAWGGDLFDNAYVGHKGTHSAYASTHNEVVEGAVEIFDRLTQAGITKHYLYQGNHDNKPMRGTQGEWSFEDFLQTKFLPHVDLEGLTIRSTNRYYMTMKPKLLGSWPFGGPWNFPWRFTHQKEYSRIPLRTAARLATKLLMNVACNHQHHLGATKHESGLLWLADTGCAQKVGATEYKDMRDSAHPQHINGFITIEDGEPKPWHYVS